MKKWVSLFILTVLVLVFLSNAVYSESFIVKIGSEESTYSGTIYNLELNGLWIPTKIPCIVVGGLAYVPLKEVFQDYLGMTVGYDSQNGLAFVHSGSKKMEFCFSRQEIVQNGTLVNTKLPVASINGNTMVPLSLTAGYFGYTVAVKPDNKTLTVQWNNKTKSDAVVKDTQVQGTVGKITYYVDDGREIVFIETQANEITRHFVLKPMEGNPYYRLCVQFKNADIEKTGSMNVYAGSIHQIRYAQADGGKHIASVVAEIDHNPDYSVEPVQGGIKIAISSKKSPDTGSEEKQTETSEISEPEPTPTSLPSPTPLPLKTPEPTPTPIPQAILTPGPEKKENPDPLEYTGKGPLRYTIEGSDCIVWLDGVDLPAMLKEKPEQYKIEYRDIEKMLQIRLPVYEDFKTEVIPGNHLLHGIISFKSNLRKEVNIRIPGKDPLNYVVASNGNTGTKIVIKGTGALAQSPESATAPVQPIPTAAPAPPEITPIPTTVPTPTPSPKITPVPTKVPTPTPAPVSEPKVSPTVTPDPTPVPAFDVLANRGDGDRSGTVSYVCGSDKLIIEPLALDEYQIFRLGNPSRIVIDLPENIIDSKEIPIPPGRHYTKIRTGQAEIKTARITLEVPENMDWESQKKGNRIIVTLIPSKIRNIKVNGDENALSLTLKAKGIRQKIEANMDAIETEDDTKAKTFSLIFPKDMIDLGNGKISAGGTIMKAVHTLSTGEKTYLVIERERPNVLYQIQFTDSDDEVLVVPVTGAESDLASRAGSQMKNETTQSKDPVPDENGMLVVLDAGHGGHDPGATYGNGEKWYNLDITLRLNEILKSKGIRTRLTRTTDVFVGLDERAEMANNWGADVFISIHNNAFFDKSMNGSMTFYYPTSYKGKEYARIIQNDMLKNLGTRDLGLKSNKFVVLKNTKMPAVLVEIACLSNDEDRAKLDTEAFRIKVAESLAESITKITGIHP